MRLLSAVVAVAAQTAAAVAAAAPINQCLATASLRAMQSLSPLVAVVQQEHGAARTLVLLAEFLPFSKARQQLLLPMAAAGAAADLMERVQALVEHQQLDLQVAQVAYLRPPAEHSVAPEKMAHRTISLTR